KGEKTPMEVYVVRREVPIKSVDAGFMLNENMGYIKINRFAETTYDEFKTALKKLLDHDMKSLVLDLRDNPGGYVYAAEQIVEEFVEKGTLIMMTKNKSEVINNTFSKRKGLFEEGNIYVLVDEMSASASE